MDDLNQILLFILLCVCLTICFCVNRNLVRDEKMALLGYCQVYIPASGAQWTKCPEVIK